MRKCSKREIREFKKRRALAGIDKIDNSYNQFLDFLASDLNEVEFYDCECDKNSLISLKEYLLELKQKMDTYEKLIVNPLSSIQNKNEWVKTVLPICDIYLNCLDVEGYNTPLYTLGMLGMNSEDKTVNPSEYVLTGSTIIYTTTSFLNPRIKRYENDIKILLQNSQDELHEINNIVQDLNIVNYPFKTISNQFEIDSRKYGYCIIGCKWGPIIECNFIKEKMESMEPTIQKEMFNIMYGNYQKELTPEENQKLIKKLYIKR